MTLFSTPKLHKQMFVLAIPMILSNITVPLIGLVDTAVIGHLEHAYYLGGSTVGAMIITFVIWLCGFLRMSTTGLASQAFGQGSTVNNQTVLVRGLMVAATVGLLMIVFQQPYLSTALYFAGGSEQVQFYAQQYASIRIYGIPAALANLVLLGWLLGNHQTKAVMWLLIVTNLVNVVFDLLFVMVFHWQVAGVAYATLIAEYSGLALGLLWVLKGSSNRLAQFKETLPVLFDRSALLGYFKLNRDILIRTLCLEICFVFITFQGARLGDNVVAANAILMNFLLLVSFGLDGVANAAEAMVGKAKGQQKGARINRIVVIGLGWTAFFASLYALAFAFAGPQLISLITDIESVATYANTYLVWMILLPLITCWCFLFDGIYIGLTEAKIMRNSMVIATFGCFFPLWFIFEEFGNHGLWLAFSSFMLARGVTLAYHYKHYLWPRFARHTSHVKSTV